MFFLLSFGITSSLHVTVRATTENSAIDLVVINQKKFLINFVGQNKQKKKQKKFVVNTKTMFMKDFSV